MEEKTIEQMDTRELVAELLRCQKKELHHARVTTVVSILLIGALLLTLLVALPRAVTLADHMEESLQQIDTFVDSASTFADRANTFVDSANSVVAQNADAVTEAVSKLNGLDFDTLNKAIQDLSDTVSPLAEFMRKFR